MNRVAIVGQAWRTPLGRTIPDAMARLLAGERATQITYEPARSRQARFLRRMGLFGLEVAHEAFAAASATPSTATLLADKTRVGLFAGVGGLRAHWDDMLKGLEHQDESGTDAWNRGLRDVHPYWMLRHLSNNVHALAAIELGLRGEGATFGGATGGAQALASAARALHANAIDAALVVAYDSLHEPETLVELAARNADIVPGEAAAALVVVRESDAREPIALLTTADIADGQRTDPRAETVALLAQRSPHDRDLSAIVAPLGQLGAASALVQAIAMANGFTAPSAFASARGAPGLASAILVEGKGER